MSKLIVYKASAGSGKTFRLAAEYIKQVMLNPQDYKRILAVTFTNKATAEMKGRIIDELFSISQGEKSSMAIEISSELNLNSDILQKQAGKALSYILHDYSLFSVSTIDSFVQRIIQALLWEIGEQGGADIKIDTDPLLELAADNLLDSAPHEPELLKWLSLMGENLLEEGGGWDVRKRLISLGNQIFSEQFRLMSSNEVEIFTDRKRVNILKNELQNLVSKGVATLNKISDEILKSMSLEGVNAELIKNKDKGIMFFINKCSKANINEKDLPLLGKREEDLLNDSTGESWISKEIGKNEAISAKVKLLVQNVLHPGVNQLNDYISQNRKHYVSAKLILKNLENLALIGDLWHNVKEISLQENFLVLSDSGHLLHEFVKDSDAPFVYEKIGNRYDSFMIDEFQDTSVVQWHNFKPLIENSLAQDSFSMLVGDVKQSIYRWRNGDWTILAQGVSNDFENHGVEIKPLKTNWRSLPAIIHFNNTFFSATLEYLKNYVKLQTTDFDQSLSDTMVNQIQSAYNDVEQSHKEGLDKNSGYVEIKLIENEDNADYTVQIEQQLPFLIQQVKRYRRPGDIAILVRSKTEGQKVANMLLNYNRTVTNPDERINFVTQEGLYLKSSSVVRFIISAFRLIQDPDNQINKRILVKELQIAKRGVENDWHKLFIQGFTDDEVEWLIQLNTKNLQEGFDAIVSRYKLFENRGELAYLAELHEIVLTQSAKGLADIGRFVEWWDQNSDSLSLSIPESANALSILTIHKSKGLEFPVVILPYLNWSFRKTNQPPLIWVSSSEAPFDLLPKYPVYSTKEANNSLFAREAQVEELNELVDNLNLLYVAFTRPMNELYMFLPKTKELESDKKIKSVHALLNQVLPSVEEKLSSSSDVSFYAESGLFQLGNIEITKSIKKDKLTSVESWCIDYSNEGLKQKKSLNLKKESFDFFRSLPTKGVAALEHGKTMHLLFSMISNKYQVDEAVYSMANDGLIKKNDSEFLIKRVKELLDGEPFNQWFSDEWDVKTEANVLTPQGFTYRPDRVMVKGKNAIVLDFKFGIEQKHYKKQVQNYLNLLTDMGYNNVEGFIWYVDAGKLEKVN